MIWPDVTELQAFYDSPLGHLVNQHLKRAVLRIWPESAGESILGIGYPLPALRVFLKSADVVTAVMPAAQGIIHWPKSAPNLTVLAYEHAIPLKDETQNRIILQHSVEHSQPLSLMLEEVTRLLTPSGRVLMILPNRRSLWARAEHTPFASGQPYSVSQIRKLLQRHEMQLVQHQEALFFPPSRSRSIRRFANVIERYGRRFFPHFGGILLIEAEKMKTAPIHGRPVKIPSKVVQLAGNYPKSF
jgi:hypothetical protein